VEWDALEHSWLSSTERAEFVVALRADLVAAEGLYRRAATDHADAMYALGVLLNERGEKVEAEKWLHQAHQRGIDGPQ
jgi:TPR repeat protein